MLKKVAATPAFSSTDMIAAVLTPGPSSNVRATVFPLPGAEWFTTAATAGHVVAAWAAARGVATVAGSAASTSDGGQGPSGNAVGGGGLGTAGAAWATGAMSDTAPASRAATRR